jgi:uncharacterized protein
MKSSVIFCLLLSWSLCSAAQDSTAAAVSNSVTVAENFVDLLAGGQFDKAARMMTAEMVKALPPDKLAQTWKGLEAQAGVFKQRESSRVEKVQQYDMIHVICRFEKASLDVKVVLDSQNRVGGLWFAPVK